MEGEDDQEETNHIDRCLFVLLFFSLPAVSAKEIKQVETEGSIGFTGTYVPIGTPDPTPPVTEIAKPKGSLPQTNTTQRNGLIRSGLLVLGFVSYLWRQKKQQLKQTNE